ncbi:urease accessory UreF family protein [Cellulosimicrobium arenosum]|uniref:Urease accessory protein UreF n=1 Tax=Cellulosimicrobium arenosum TaxID=2708133 RepID=A0A927J003_9MICO|nr:urease accessory UreF family protein [Cellulosimicrobium arenosum]MBD8079072.1 urease accessory protein UreF [Cellulosimicrobium arenosum]
MLALLADARLPTGGHTQSAGLEPALRAGMDPARVPDYLRARLATVTRVEAATAVVARHVVMPDATGCGPSSGAAAMALAETWHAWAARTPSAALRDTSQRLGRGYLRLLRRLWAGDPRVLALDEAARLVTADHAADRASDLGRDQARGVEGSDDESATADGRGRAASGTRNRGAQPPRPLVLGVTAACAGLSALQVARLVGYEDTQTVAAATLKLAPIDPVDATGWVVAAQPAIDALAYDVAPLTDPRAIPAHGAPLVEQWAEIHARTTERLFSA